MLIHREVVTGGREFLDSDRIERDRRSSQRLGVKRCAQGGARGADQAAQRLWRIVCNDMALDSESTYWIDDALDGPRPNAGNVRNRRMLDAELALAAAAGERMIVWAYPDPGSRGTWNCVADALRRGLPVVLWPMAIEAASAVRRLDDLKRELAPAEVRVGSHRLGHWLLTLAEPSGRPRLTPGWSAEDLGRLPYVLSDAIEAENTEAA